MDVTQNLVRVIKCIFFFSRPPESDDKSKPEEDEVFLTSCDLTLTPTKTESRGKGCIIRSNVSEELDESVHSSARFAGWKNYFQACLKKLNDHWWMLSVRCVGSSPKCCNDTWLCCLLDRVCIFFTNIEVNKKKYTYC